MENGNEGISFLQINPEDLKVPFNASVSEQTGAANVVVDIPLTAGRNGIQPGLTLAYSSGSRNSVFGSGWDLQGIPSIGISLKDGYPKYDHTDKYAFGGQELIVWMVESDGVWEPRTEENDEFYIQYFRNKVDTSFTRFEKWINKISRAIHWRVHSQNNQVMIFGHSSDNSSKIYDPADTTRIFQWLLEEVYDNMGNAMRYEYISESHTNIDANTSYERNRIYKGLGNAQKYLKRIYYGNTTPVLPHNSISDPNWLYEVVFDFGEHPLENQIPQYDEVPEQLPVRPDAFSSYIAGFEQRIYRLCHRVLMFHRIEELGQTPTLVGSLELNHDLNASGSTISDIFYKGFRRNGDQYEFKILPPLLFEYTSPSVQSSFLTAPEQSIDNIPAGLGGLNYKWVDLYGEGLPGILYESNDVWYYKPNLGGGRLGKQQKVAEKPNLSFGTYALSDFDRDGNLNLVIMQGRESGYYEYNRDKETWNTFTSFTSTPHIRQMDVNTQLLDLTGDGRADILTTEEDRIIWYPSKGKEGFGEPKQIAKPLSNGVSRTPMIGSNPMLDYFFVDMNASGLPDQVHVYNGKVEYWPNLGNGNFGAGIIMEDAPHLDFDFELDASRIRLVDLDGSGTSDLVYLGRGELTYWINASGNRFVEGGTITGLPFIDNISSAQIIDFLGNGTPCLVWSSMLAIHADSPVHYLELTNGVKPRLLTSIENSMGLETRFHYGYSGEHYLRDKQSDYPWMTRIPSHQTVADAVEMIDHIAHTRFMQRYEYHDGFYDGEERAFRGFCLVDQYDSDSYLGSSTIPETQFTDPVCVRKWFHNGAPGWQQTRSESYYPYDSYSTQLKDFHIETINDLGSEEFFDLIRSVAGQPLRTETYGLTREGIRNEHPFQVTHTNYTIRRTQPGTEIYDPSVAVFQRESLEIIYEEDAEDPLIRHSMYLGIDDFGVPVQQVAIAYPRIHEEATEEQQLFHIKGSETNVLHIDERDRYEIAIPLESKSFEFRHTETPSEGNLYDFEIIKSVFDVTSGSPISFDEEFTLEREAKLLQWSKNYYWNDAQTEVLPWRSVGRKILIHHSETACFHNRFLESVLEDRYTERLAIEGHYVFHDELWWQSSAILEYLPENKFYLPSGETQIDGGRVIYTYDPYYVTLTGSTAVLVDQTGVIIARNTTSAIIDYHVIAPFEIEDANRNISEVYYDPFGVIIRSSLHGELLSDTGVLEPFGHNHLENYIEPDEISFDVIVQNPEQYLQECASFFYYELDSWQRFRLPLRSLNLVREEWVFDGNGNYQPEGNFQLSVNYVDGFSRTVQTKTLVEAGEDTIRYNDDDEIVVGSDGEPELYTSTEPRWRVSGHTIYNNKQQPVQQYEPYFSPIIDFENDEVLETFGVSGLLEYDALGRQKRIILADGTQNYVEITPWQTRQYDANDAIVGSLYALRVEATYPSDSPERIALQKSEQHYNTPVITNVDALGRVFLTEEADENGNIRRNRIVHDELGNPSEIIDPRGLIAFTYARDMQGRVFHEVSMDAGLKWQFVNALNQPVHLWDGKDVHQQLSYDTWGRVTEKFVDGALDMNHLTERYVYAENTSSTDLWQHNLAGQLVEYYDQSGVHRFHRFDILGNVLFKDRCLLENYQEIPDWLGTVTPVWMADPAFETRMTYDALGRPVLQDLPDGTTRRYHYFQSGAVHEILLSTEDGLLSEQPIVRESKYNARGQRKELVLGNDVVQQYEYDTLNFRLQRKTSFRRATANTPARQYQNMRYIYDAVGNITHIVDTAGPNDTLLFSQPRIQQYTYDAFYQLIQAEGRTHEALERTDYAHATDSPGFVKGTRHISLSNMNLVRTYTRRYEYDLNGNMRSMTHHSGTRPGDVLRWRRNLWISETSNRSLELEDLNGVPVTDPETRFDENGNLSYMSHLRQVEWNYLNQLSAAVIIERTSDENDAEYYVYGGDGQRVRKITRRMNNGEMETIEKIYLDGCEIKRVRQGDTLLLERYTSHLSDGEERVGLLHQWTIDTLGAETDTISDKRIHYQLNDHLGSSTYELNEDGDIINYEEYFAFGGSAFMFGAQIRDVQLKDYRYTGKERDDATQLYYYGYRYYAPWLCRWLNPDPIGPEDGLNIYQFVHNNPINEVDPDGLQSSIPELRILGTAPVQYPDGSIEEIITYSQIEEGRQGVEENIYVVRSGRDSSGEPWEQPPQLIRTIERSDIVAERDGNYVRFSRREIEENPMPLEDREPIREHPLARPNVDELIGSTSDEEFDAIINELVEEQDFENLINELIEDGELDDFINELANSLDQDESETPNSEGIYRPYGSNEHLNYAAGVGESFLNMVGLSGEEVADDIVRYERGDLQVRLEIIDSYNPFAFIRDRASEAFDEGYRFGESEGLGTATGIAYAVDALNPFAHIRDVASEAFDEGYRFGESEGLGTLTGVAYVIEAINPFAHIRDSITDTVDAIERGDAYSAGRSFNNASIQTATVIEGFRGVSVRRSRDFAHSRIVDGDHHAFPVRRGSGGIERPWIRQRGGRVLTTREWLAERGIDIDRYTYRLTPGEHDAIHRRLRRVERRYIERRLERTTDPGRRAILERELLHRDWNEQWYDWINANPNATATEIFQFLDEMRGTRFPFLRDQPLIPYRFGRD